MMKNKYNFSIIMSVYNVEGYIEEAIDSLINQSLDFEENIQLIIVNDGSIDKSGEICQKYLDRYPNNIEYYEKENGGLSSARNFGLDYVKGRYINFFDPDDILSKDALQAVLNFFEEHSNINMAGLIVEYVGNKSGVHPRYDKFGKETTIVNLKESPQNYILSAAATFYRAHLFNNMRFDTNLPVAEDLYTNCQFYFDNDSVGIIGYEEAVYYYRIRKESVSLTGANKYDIDTCIHTTRYVYENFMRLLNEKQMEMPEFLKYILLGEIKKRNKVLNQSKDENKKEEFYNICRKIFLNIEDKYIVNFYDPSHMLKIAFFTLKYGWQSDNIEYKIQDNLLYANSKKIGKVNECKIIVSDIDIYENKIQILGVYNDIYPINTDTSLRFKDSKGKTYIINIKSVKNEFFINKTLGLGFNNQYKYTMSLPLNNINKYIPILKAGGLEIPIKFSRNTGKFVYDDYVQEYEIYKLLKSSKDVAIENSKITVTNKNIFTKLLYEIRRIRFISNQFNVNSIYRLLALKHKKYILFNDRPISGDDNAQALFEYVCKNDKKLAKRCYYISSKEAANYGKLKKIGKVLISGSIKHKLKYLNAKLVVSSHVQFFNPFNADETYSFRDLIDHKFVFLQHGVIMNDVHKVLNKGRFDMDMFVTSTKKEYEEITTNRFMFDNEVVITGLPRFDKLENNKEKIVLVAPTWRTFLSGPINKNGIHDEAQDFENSEYYIRYSRLLENKKLLESLKNNGYRIIFLLHPGFKLYKHHFMRLQNEIIEIKDVQDITYSELFSKIALLVTDYSSIIFDVAYLKKPMLLYQFDAEKYFSEHYEKSYFSYEIDGFGKVIKDENVIIDEVIKSIENNCENAKEYLDRIENTFVYLDKNNCRRVWNKIKEKQLL